MTKRLVIFIAISLLITACSLSFLPTQETNAPVLNETLTVVKTTEQLVLPTIIGSVPTQTINPYPEITSNSVELNETEKSVYPTPTVEIVFRDLQPDVNNDEYEYELQNFSPAFLPNFAHPENGCKWMGVAGQVFNQEGYPQEDIVIVVEGIIGEENIEGLGFSGLAMMYGPGGYEVILSDQAQPGLFWLQLFDIQGAAVSGILQFEMSGNCEQNLALINFYQTDYDYQLFVPLIQR